MSASPIQMRVVIRSDGDRDVRTLEMRTCFAVDTRGGFCPDSWGEWERVPELTLLEAYEVDEEERTERRLSDLHGP